MKELSDGGLIHKSLLRTRAFKQASRQVIIELIVIEDAQENAHNRAEHRMYAAHVRQ